MEGGVGCERTLVLAGAASESVMAAAAELSRPTIGDRSLEQSCSPSLSREIVCEVFRSLHNLAGQVSDVLWSRGLGTGLPLPPFSLARRQGPPEACRVWDPAGVAEAGGGAWAGCPVG